MKQRQVKTERGKMPRGKRVENKEKTRNAILRAALELFAKRGFHRTTTKEISRRAGIAEGTLFNYFPTKEDLALYFFERELDGLMDWFRKDKSAQDAPLPEKLFAIIHHLLERLSPYEDFIGAVYLRALQPASKLSPFSLPTQERHFRYLRFIREILAEAEAEEEIPAVGDIGAYAFGIYHIAMITYWLQDRSPGKENTLALLDRCLKLGANILRKGGWEW
ncbi:MAG TPA: TetR/AcrR family transcriptional regulator [Verrucomicrobiae bacterium]|nr:TetR/AcrR family transcriptional regulator [Verrucomicrobiae bacterium]